MIYLYNYENLYPKYGADRTRLGHPMNVQPMTFECHRVRRQTSPNGITGTRGWEFMLVNDPNGEVWYVTSYDWALVLKTDENLAQYAKWSALKREWQHAQNLARVQHDLILGPAQMIGKNES